MMKTNARRVIRALVIVCLIVIAVCNVFIHRTIADLTLAIGVLLMGRAYMLDLFQERS